MGRAKRNPSSGVVHSMGFATLYPSYEAELKDHLWHTTMDKLAVDQPNYDKRELGKS